MASYEKTRPIKAVVEGDKLHYQTDPYVENGKVKIRRLATIPIKIEDHLAILKLKKSIKDLEEYEKND